VRAESLGRLTDVVVWYELSEHGDERSHCKDRVAPIFETFEIKETAKRSCWLGGWFSVGD
jgi:hypothetical protein